MANIEQCQWWLELDTEEGHIFITRKKNGHHANIHIEGMRAGSNPSVVKVKTVHCEKGLMEKGFNLNDFQSKQNDVSGSMSTSLESGQDFVEQWLKLCKLHKKERNAQTADSLQNTAPENHEENTVTDACDMDAINRKRVKFGHDYILEVPVRLLSSPAKLRLVRELNHLHVVELRESFAKQKCTTIFSTLAVHIPNSLPRHVTREDVLKGKYTLEVLGGNHTREALTQLDGNLMVPATIYAGLSNDQALVIGYEHNKINEKSRKMTFSETVHLFRRKIPADPDQSLTQSERTQWRKDMATIFSTSIIEVRTKYRVHSWLASQPRNLWLLISQFMAAWDTKSLKDQRSVPLKAHHMSFLKELSTDDAMVALQKLLGKEISHQETKPKPQDRVPKRPSETVSREWETELRKKEKRLKEWEEDLLRREQLLKLHTCTCSAEKAADNDTSDDVIMESQSETESDQPQTNGPHPFVTKQIHLLIGGDCIPGDWVAVHYSGTRTPPVGRVADIDNGNTATVQFLKGKKLSNKDIQTVDRRFIICKANVEHNIERDEIHISQLSKNEIEEKKMAYLEVLQREKE